MASIKAGVSKPMRSLANRISRWYDLSKLDGNIIIIYIISIIHILQFEKAPFLSVAILRRCIIRQKLLVADVYVAAVSCD